MDCLDSWDHRAVQVIQVQLDQQVTLVTLEQLEYQVTKVPLVRLALWVRLDSRVSLALRVILVNREQPVHLDNKDQLGQRDRRVMSVSLDNKVHKVQLVKVV